MLALSLVGWVALCAYVWVLLGETTGLPASDPVAEAESGQVDPVEVSERSDPSASPNLDKPSTGNVLSDLDTAPEAAPEESVTDSISPETGTVQASVPLPQIISDSSVVEEDSTPEAVRPQTELAESAAEPTPEAPVVSEQADLVSESPLGEQAGVPLGPELVLKSTDTTLPEIADLLEGFQSAEGPGESEAGDVVMLPLAPESNETSYARKRQEELSVLSELSSRLTFEAGSAERTARVQTVLDRIFDPLFLYADTSIEVTVNSNDLASPADNRQLSRLRGRVLVDYLAQRGLDTSRFVVVSEGGRGLAIGAHRVQVISEVLP